MAAPDTDAPTVLLVDDEPDLVELLQYTLEQAGYRALLAADATTALEILGHTPVDLTLTDIKMPEMNGLELLGEIRRRDAYAEVMLITARSSVPEAVNALQYGAADYLEKPIDVRRLRHTLRILLERRQPLKHRRATLRLGQIPPRRAALGRQARVAAGAHQRLGAVGVALEAGVVESGPAIHWLHGVELRLVLQ